jgi:hypothetical protein
MIPTAARGQLSWTLSPHLRRVQVQRRFGPPTAVPGHHAEAGQEWQRACRSDRVTASAVTVTVSNRAGESVSVTSPAVGAATSYIALLTTWRDAGATASFWDFAYRPGHLT